MNRAERQARTATPDYARCTRPASPTCALPGITRDSSQYTCGACGRVWRPANDGHGRYWKWDGHTINKPRREVIRGA